MVKYHRRRPVPSILLAWFAAETIAHQLQSHLSTYCLCEDMLDMHAWQLTCWCPHTRRYFADLVIAYLREALAGMLLAPAAGEAWLQVLPME